MTSSQRNAKAPRWGALIGFAVAAALSYSFILPPNVRHLQLSDVKVGDWVLVSVALVISLVCAWMGYIVGDAVADPDD